MFTAARRRRGRPSLVDSPERNPRFRWWDGQRSTDGTSRTDVRLAVMGTALRPCRAAKPCRCYTLVHYPGDASAIIIAALIRHWPPPRLMAVLLQASSWFFSDRYGRSPSRTPARHLVHAVGEPDHAADFARGGATEPSDSGHARAKDLQRTDTDRTRVRARSRARSRSTRPRVGHRGEDGVKCVGRSQEHVD